MSAMPMLASVLGLLLIGHATAAEIDGNTLAHQGNGRGAAPCIACHGADGGGQGAAGFPRLAGMPAAYLRKQLDDFAAGTRDNASMKPVAAALSESERTALATYYASLPVPAPAPATAPAMANASNGAMLASRGRWSQGLPACVQCHASDGNGVGEHFPPLVGQSAVYLANQLHAWKAGTRHNDPLNLMQSVAARLSDADIDAVTAWYAAQPMGAHSKESRP
jgi:cytochrome c553